MTNTMEDSDLVTPAQVAGWKGERERLMGARDKISMRIAMLDRLIEAGEEWAASDVQVVVKNAEATKPEVKASGTEPSVSRSKAPAVSRRRKQPQSRARSQDSGQTWTATMLRLITKAPDGISYAELKRALEDTHLAEKLKETDKSFYGAIGKLEAKGEIKKRAGYLFTPANLALFLDRVASGAVEDKGASAPFSAPRSSPMRDVILELLAATSGVGVSTAVILDEIDTNPKLPPLKGSLRNRHTSVYNLLVRMVKNGELTKENGVYRLPLKENEPRRPYGSGGSDADEVGASSKDSQRAFRLAG